MLESGDYTTYKEFGLDLIHILEDEGFSLALLNKEEPKSRILQTPQGIELLFVGYKSNRPNTLRRLERPSYDCLVRYNNENVEFKTICQEIIYKCTSSENIPLNLITDILYIFLKEVSEHPLTTVDTIFDKYLPLDGRLKPICQAEVELSERQLLQAIDDFKHVWFTLDKVGKFTWQEMIDIISYIAIIEEFNYPLKDNCKLYRGRSDCFGRYVEVLYGGEEVLDKLLEGKAFKAGANFQPNPIIQEEYFHQIEKDRIQLSKDGQYY
ncbi:TPA: hypothetical protein ACGPB3_000740 [Streptococcus suis]